MQVLASHGFANIYVKVSACELYICLRSLLEGGGVMGVGRELLTMKSCLKK